MLFSIYFLCTQVTKHTAAAEAIVKAHKADLINLVFIRHQILKSELFYFYFVSLLKDLLVFMC